MIEFGVTPQSSQLWEGKVQWCLFQSSPNWPSSSPRDQTHWSSFPKSPAGIRELWDGKAHLIPPLQGHLPLWNSLIFLSLYANMPSLHSAARFFPNKTSKCLGQKLPSHLLHLLVHADHFRLLEDPSSPSSWTWIHPFSSSAHHWGTPELLPGTGHQTKAAFGRSKSRRLLPWHGCFHPGEHKANSQTFLIESLPAITSIYWLQTEAPQQFIAIHLLAPGPPSISARLFSCLLHLNSHIQNNPCTLKWCSHTTTKYQKFIVVVLGECCKSPQGFSQLPGIEAFSAQWIGMGMFHPGDIPSWDIPSWG